MKNVLTILMSYSNNIVSINERVSQFQITLKCFKLDFYLLVHWDNCPEDS